jgi:hypothetical protein
VAGEDADDGAVDPVYPQFAVPLGVVFGLLLTAVACLVVAWLHREPRQPFEPDPAAISSMLVRTTVVVVFSAVLVLGCFAFGGLWQRRSHGVRRKFVAYSAPMLVVVGVVGWLQRDAGATGAAFEAAAKAQVGLGSFEPTVMAAVAWCCACAAVIVLAVVCRLGYVRPDSPEPAAVARHHRHPLTAAVVAVMIVAAVTPVAVVQAQQRSYESRTAAADVAIQPPAPLAGEVVYEVAGDDLKDYITSAGPGFVAVSDADPQDVVNGYDGATGGHRWSFGVPGSGFYGLASTGTGADSVAVLDSAFQVFALDATTGAPLWTRDEVSLDPDDPQRTVGERVVLVNTPQPGPPGPTAGVSGTLWIALSPRTGEELWRREFRYECDTRVQVTDTAVLMRSCEDGPDVVVNVLDPVTGETRRVLTRTDVGPAPPDTRFFVSDAVDDTALVSAGYSSDVPTRAVDLTTGVVSVTTPPGRSAVLLDARSLLLTDVEGDAQQILDLDTGRTFETRTTGEYRGVAEPGWHLWVRYGSEWVTFSGSALRVAGPGGAARSLPVPACGETDAQLAAVPGAVLVDCDDRWVAVR